MGIVIHAARKKNASACFAIRIVRACKRRYVLNFFWGGREEFLK